MGQTLSYGSCEVCGLEMDEDPARSVECPTCGADAGSPCKRPSGHTVWCGNHQARINRGVSNVCPKEGEPCWDAGEKPESSEDPPTEEQATLPGY